MADLSTSWTRRLFERTGLGTVWVGVSLLAISVLVFAIQELMLGRLTLAEEDAAGGVRIALVHIVILTYLLTAYVYCEQTCDASIGRIRPLLAPGLSRASLEISRSDRVQLFCWGLLGIALAILNTLYVSPGPASYDPSTWSPESGWHRVLGVCIGFWAAKLSVLILLDSGRLSELAESLQEIDLLDLHVLAPFATRGLTNALLAIGTVSVFALFLVDTGYVGLVVSLLVACLAVGGVALLLPLRGVRERVHAAKQRELGWCRERLRAARADLAAGNVRPGELQELVAWESRIEGINEWTVDSSTLTRFALYLLIPIGSWAGGAVVERLLDALLG